jgi:hypothetical protein
MYTRLARYEFAEEINASLAEFSGFLSEHLR